MTTPYGGGGFVNNLLGGVMGTMAGTNPLQSSVDQLTNAINRLTTVVGAGTIGAGNRVGQQQGQTAAGGFPPVNVPGMTRQAGIGGGGPGGTGNVRPPTPFGRLGVGLAGGIMLGGAFANYGQQQMPFQIGLNAMATQSMLGMSGMNSGMGNFAPTFSQLANQGGLPLASGGMDYLQMTQGLQFLGGSPRFQSTALGRAGFGAAAAFGMTNPALSGAASASLAQQIYNPNLSMRMRMLGYNTTPRVMGSGMPQSIGNISASLIQGWYGKSRVNPAQLYKTLSMGGRGFTNLQYLGLNPQQMAPLLEGFNQLFNAGYSPQRASDMFAAAASNNPNISRPAQAALTRAGVRTVSSDIQKLKNAQAPVTQRSINTAAGFDAALTSSTDLLQRFNQVLNNILNTTGMNGPLGALGGAFGVMSGTNHGNFMQGLGGIGLMGLAARGLFGGGGGSLLGGLGGGAGGVLGRVGLGGIGGAGLAAGAGGAAAAALFASKYHFGHSGTLWQQGSPGWGGHNTGWNSWSGLASNFGNWWDNAGRMAGMIGQFGGATTAPSATSRQASNKSAMSSGVSSSAAKAVSAAESQLGVPYVWGGEQPGVGFDCSGLVQWAYKQAGVNLPRTSQLQWSALRRRSIPTNQAREGDLVFMAGADGTPNSPGHVGMMINNRQLIEAPTTGQDVKIIGFDPRQWSHAARPVGGVGSLSGTSAPSVSNTGSTALPGTTGNIGIGMGIGNYGSANEVDLISSTGGFLGGGGAFSAGGLGGVMSTNTGGSNAGSTMGRGIPMGSGSKQIAAEKAYAMMLLKARGWGNQFGSLNSIIMAESSWRWNAANPSGAYGIPQALPGSKMASAGKDWRTNPDTQLRWMIDTYIPQRYGTPNQAWAFHQRNGWYADGAKSPMQGWSWVGERGPELMFTGGGNSILNNAQSLALMKAVTNQPAQSPWQNLSGSMQYQGKVIYPGINQPTGGASITVTFTKDSVNINMPAGASTDVQSIGKALAQQTVQHMERELLHSTIAKGIKN